MEDTSFVTTAPGTLLLSLAIMLVCVPLKRTPHVPNWLIPYICLFLGAVGYSLLQESFQMRNILVGTVLGGFAVGMHQSIKQGREGFMQVFTGPPSDGGKFDNTPEK